MSTAAFWVSLRYHSSKELFCLTRLSKCVVFAQEFKSICQIKVWEELLICMYGFWNKVHPLKMCDTSMKSGQNTVKVCLKNICKWQKWHDPIGQMVNYIRWQDCSHSFLVSGQHSPFSWDKSTFRAFDLEGSNLLRFLAAGQASGASFSGLKWRWSIIASLSQIPKRS